MNNQQDNKESSVMGQDKMQTEESSKKTFRIKTLEELNQTQSRYKGKTTGAFKAHVKPVKSVEELNQVNEKSKIRYGRSNEEEPSVSMNLDDFQYPWEKADADLKEQPESGMDMQMESSVPNFILQGGIEDETKENSEPDSLEEESDNVGYTYSANGLNFDYLQSILEETEEEEKAEMGRINRAAFFASKQSELEGQDKDAGLADSDLVKKEAGYEVNEGDILDKKDAKHKMNEDNISDKKDARRDDNEEKKEEIAQLKAKIEQLKHEIENAEKEKVVEDTQNASSSKEPSITENVSNETDSQPSEEKTENEAGEEEAVILEEKESITLYKVVKEIMTYTICIGVAIVLSFVLVAFVVQKTEVIGDSMEPTLKHQEQLVIDKISYRFGKPDRFDVVVFPHENTNYIKRVIGLPGETVSIEEGYIYIDGQMLYDDTYGMEAITSDHYYRLSEPVVLGEDEYFVMGDNRNNSKDSRDGTVGNVKKDQIIGRVIFRIWPFEKLGTLD